MIDTSKTLNSKTFKIIFFLQLLFALTTFGSFVSAQASNINSSINPGNILSESQSSENKLAPGEFLPVSVKLVNFGAQKRVDVQVNYEILDGKNNIVYSENETVAVETTASFVKRIQLPYNIKPGLYTVESILTYPDQQQPAMSKFPLLVEQKIAGVFQSDLIFYSVIFVLAALTIIILVYLFKGWNRRRPFDVHDYTDKPKDQMIYYEILSDMISQMRLRIGDDAIEIAKNIPDLQINDKNGFVINIKKDPAKIIATLVSNYEKVYGQKISFGLRQK